MWISEEHIEEQIDASRGPRGDGRRNPIRTDEEREERFKERKKVRDSQRTASREGRKQRRKERVGKCV